MNQLKFIDLCCGMGGFHLAMTRVFPNAQCVYAADIKPASINVYKDNFGIDCKNNIMDVELCNIPDFDIMFSGFPCQSFSSAGKRKGFDDIRGTVFFHLLKIIKAKNPPFIVLENVEGLLTHKKGITFKTIKNNLEKVGYYVSYKVISGLEINIPQNRKRLFIVCTKEKVFSFPTLQKSDCKFSQIQQTNIKEHIIENSLTKNLLKNYSGDELVGKKINDKRGGPNNIHSWDLGLKGKIPITARNMMNQFLLNRRKKYWATKNNIPWKDGMCLSFDNISSFYEGKDLKKTLNDLLIKGYLKETKKDWYDMYGGNLSFSITQILHPDKPTSTIVATDAHKLAVFDNNCLRRLTIVELLRLFGYNENYDFSSVSRKHTLDLLGNTIIVPIVESILSQIRLEHL